MRDHTAAILDWKNDWMYQAILRHAQHEVQEWLDECRRTVDIDLGPVHDGGLVEEHGMSELAEPTGPVVRAWWVDGKRASWLTPEQRSNAQSERAEVESASYPFWRASFHLRRHRRRVLWCVGTGRLGGQGLTYRVIGKPSQPAQAWLKVDPAGDGWRS